MKRILFALLVTFSFSLFADTWTDPETEITWTYVISSGNGEGAYADLTNGGYGSEKPVISEYTAGTITIPSTLGGYPVKYVGRAAFWDCKAISSVIIPEGVLGIRAGAFQGCTALSSVKLPTSLTSIEKYAFYHCLSLKKVVIPEGVATLYEYAFSGCAKATIVIPASMQYLDQYSLSSVSEVIFKGKPPATVNRWAASGVKAIKYVSSPESWASYYAMAKAVTIVDDSLNSYSLQQPFLPINIPWTYVGGKVSILPTFGGSTAAISETECMYGETVTAKATPQEGYVFLGWSSDVAGISGADPTLTFTMPEREEVHVIASFFPKALLETWFNEAVRTTVKEEVEAKIDGETLLTAEQAATKTSATIDAKVEKGELITSDQLQVMAMKTPVIAVEEGCVTLDLALQSAASLDGEWQQVEMEAAELTEEGAISVSVPANEKASFYKFVVPKK